MENDIKYGYVDLTRNEMDMMAMLCPNGEMTDAGQHYLKSLIEKKGQYQEAEEFIDQMIDGILSEAEPPEVKFTASTEDAGDGFGYRLSPHTSMVEYHTIVSLYLLNRFGAFQ